jgi:MFS family permease
MSDSQQTAKQLDGTRAAAWLVLAVLLLFSVAAPLNQNKVPPIMPILIKELGLSVSSAGLLMSVFAVTGLILALPAGLIYQKAGARVTGLLAGGSILLGAALGALSHSFGALLASRAIEGIGTSFMAVLAPAIIAQWFTARQRGTAMGIWATWVPVGTTTMLLLPRALPRRRAGTRYGGLAPFMRSPSPCSTWHSSGQPQLRLRRRQDPRRHLLSPPPRCCATAISGCWPPPLPPLLV